MMSVEEDRYFDQYRVLSNRIAFHTEQLCRMRRELDALSCRWGENISSHKQDAPYIRQIERIQDTEEKLKEENELQSRLQEEMEMLIGTLSSEKWRYIMMYRYLEGLSFPQIGDLLGVTEITARRQRNRALDFIVLPEEHINIFLKNDSDDRK